MRLIYTLLILVTLSSCKSDKNEHNPQSFDQDELINPVAKDHTETQDLDIKNVDKSIAIELKQNQLIEKKDESEALQELIIDEHYRVDKKDYTINFNYPLLNESFKPTNSNFNDFIEDYYVNITKTESDILESKLLCDSIEASKFREERFIDYKIYSINDQLVSILFYKENFYSGAMHPSLSFDAFNFDLERGVFMTYEDFFKQGSEEELVEIINDMITTKMKEGSLYYDCWELYLDDFMMHKNNFVFNDDIVEFYFDDCVICPSYTGTYSIELKLIDLLAVLRKYELNPLEF